MANPSTYGVLRNLRIKRVALVDSGANLDRSTLDGAHIVLFKRDADAAKSMALGDVHVDSTDWSDYEKANLDAETRNKLPDSAFAAVWTGADGQKQRKLPIHDAGHLAAARGRLDAADIPATVKAEARRKIEAAGKRTSKSTKKEYTVKELLKKMLGLATETDAEKRTTAAAELAKAFEDMKDDDDTNKAFPHKPDDEMCKCADCAAKRTSKKAEEDAKLTKAIGEEVAKRIEGVEKANLDLAKRNTELLAQIDVEKSNRLDREMVDILKGFRATPFDMKTDVAKFRKLKEADPATFDRTMELLKATDAQLAQSALYKNVGSSASGSGGDAWAQIEAKADTLVEKDTKGMTREQAIEKVMFANPKLVAQYRAEMQ